MIDNELCEPTDEGVNYINETWVLFLDSLQLKDTGFADFDSLMESADN